VSLVSNSEELKISDYVSIRQASKIKNVSYDSMRMFLRNNPGKITTKRVGSLVYIYIHDLTKYTPLR
jgi:hypothetical protein